MAHIIIESNSFRNSDMKLKLIYISTGFLDNMHINDSIYINKRMKFGCFCSNFSLSCNLRKTKLGKTLANNYVYLNAFYGGYLMERAKIGNH